MRHVPWIVVPIVLVALLGLAVFATRGPGATTAFTLKAGDCFDIPSDAQIGDIPTIDCSTPHDAEVFVAGALPTPSASPSDAVGGPPPYPGGTGIGQWVVDNCGSGAEAAYLAGNARGDLAVGYFFPDPDAWTRGERQVTCYLHTPDGTKLTAPLGGSTGSAAPS